MEIDRVKDFVFDKVRKHASKMIEGKYQNKAYKFSVAELRDNTLENKIIDGGYGDWSAVFAFVDTKGKVQYIGKAYTDVWRPLWDHVENEDNDISDNWTILVLYGKLWICTHEWIKAQLRGKFPDAKYWD